MGQISTEYYHRIQTANGNLFRKKKEIFRSRTEFEFIFHHTRIEFQVRPREFFGVKDFFFLIGSISIVGLKQFNIEENYVMQFVVAATTEKKKISFDLIELNGARDNFPRISFSEDKRLSKKKKTRKTGRKRKAYSCL